MIVRESNSDPYVVFYGCCVVSCVWDFVGLTDVLGSARCRFGLLWPQIGDMLFG